MNGAAGVVDWPGHEDGAPLHGKSLTYPQRFYRLNADLELRFGGNAIRATKGSILMLGCYRMSCTSRPLPAVNLLRGALKVSSTGEHPAGVITEQGLFDPRVTKELVYTVKRQLTKPGEVTMKQLISWFAFIPDQPRGTTTVSFAQAGRRDALCRRESWLAPLRPRCSADTTTRYGVGTATYRP